VFFGDTYETEISQDTNFVVNIHSTVMSWISIPHLHPLPLTKGEAFRLDSSRSLLRRITIWHPIAMART
jgi:hypothetical protein